eukprot:jgi/Chlat1/351/Chrsp10S01524
MARRLAQKVAEKLFAFVDCVETMEAKVIQLEARLREAECEQRALLRQLDERKQDSVLLTQRRRDEREECEHAKSECTALRRDNERLRRLLEEEVEKKEHNIKQDKEEKEEELSVQKKRRLSSDDDGVDDGKRDEEKLLDDVVAVTTAVLPLPPRVQPALSLPDCLGDPDLTQLPVKALQSKEHQEEPSGSITSVAVEVTKPTNTKEGTSSSVGENHSRQSRVAHVVQHEARDTPPPRPTTTTTVTAVQRGKSVPATMRPASKSWRSKASKGMGSSIVDTDFMLLTPPPPPPSLTSSPPMMDVREQQRGHKGGSVVERNLQLPGQRAENPHIPRPSSSPCLASTSKVNDENDNSNGVRMLGVQERAAAGKQFHPFSSRGPMYKYVEPEVGRHRHAFKPPSTPDGFWNIGFGTEDLDSA